MKKIKERFNSKKSKLIAIVSMACLMMSMACVTAFADEVAAETFPITSAMLEPVRTNMLSAVDVAAPIGLSIMGVMLGIRLVPKLLKRLSKG